MGMLRVRLKSVEMSELEYITCEPKSAICDTTMELEWVAD